ncbi:MAG: hypothetical protein ACLTCQ_17970 [Enterocloster bolteae]
MVTSIGLSSVQIFAGKSEREVAGNGTGAIEKRPDSMKLFERKKHDIQLKKRRFSQLLPDFPHSAARLFLTAVKIPSEFVGGQCASWRFPPKAAVSACSRHSFVEGIRNGGLEMFFKTAGKDGISK